MGNFLDFLEFSLFSSLLPFISRDLIGGHESSENASLAYLLFYIGFLGRPFGALIFGYLGDTFGRKKALTLSLTGMSISTLLLGMIPSFSYAYILIVIIRFTQGIFTGGEYSNAAVYVLENVSSKIRFINIGNLTASGILGASMGQGIGMLVSTELIPFLTWRLIFILVATISLYVAMMRLYHLSENSHSKQRITYNGIKSFLYSRYVVMGIIFGGILNSLFCLIYTFLGTYSSLITEKYVFSSYLISLLCSLMMGGFLIVCSRLPIIEKYTSSQLIKFSLITMIALLYPMYTGISNGRFEPYSLIVVALFIAIMQLFALITIKSIPENLPSHCRVLLSGLPGSIGGSLIGGASPFISAELIGFSNNMNAPIYYFIALMIAGLFAIIVWPLKNIVQE